MLIKVINSFVKQDKRYAFSYSQKHWSALAHIEGFLGQFGGWNIVEPTDACIIGIWKDTDSYRSFMNDFHDDIFYKNGQKASYDKLETTLSSNGQFVKGIYHHTRSSIVGANYMMITSIAHNNLDKSLTPFTLISERDRCLSTFVFADEHTSTFISLFGYAPPDATKHVLQKNKIPVQQQNIYKLEKEWTVLQTFSS
ncbi:YdbC family protein [Priestia endophytica]|uniref:YdbC family protein n=1 Tax=Priestia endophytica TaxID=135735 RepID=UPI002E1F54AB|nr:YdbC family protein [Priestia endophytica]